ncbi:MAG TPA: DUF2125 domain-containing protein [Rhizomicrobium sp.]
MRYSNRFFLYAPFLILAVIAAVAGLRWWASARAFETMLERTNGHELAPGVTLHFAAKALGGFPFRVDAVLRDVALDSHCMGGTLAWHAERFAIHRLTYGRDQSIFEAAGAQSLTWIGPDGTQRRFTFTPGSLRASAIFSGGRLARFDLDVTAIGSREIAGDRVQIHLRQSPGPDAIDLAISADAIRLAPDLQAGLGADLSHLAIAGRVLPAASLAPLLSGRERWCASLEDWRRRRGTLDLDSIDVAWGRIGARGGGRLSLDDFHRPRGALELAVAGSPQSATPGSEGAKLSQAGRAWGAPPAAGEALEIAVGDGAVVLRRNGARNGQPVGTHFVDPIY